MHLQKYGRQQKALTRSNRQQKRLEQLRPQAAVTASRTRPHPMHVLLRMKRGQPGRGKARVGAGVSRWSRGRSSRT